MKNPSPKILSAIEITGMSSDGRGIGKTEGKVVFVDFAAEGDIADVAINRSRKNYAEAEIVSLLNASALRETPHCSHFGVCGGCKWQHIQYVEQLRFKKQIVEDAFRKIGRLDFPEVADVLGASSPYFYRNKLDFAFTERRWLNEDEIQSRKTFEHRNGLGFHVPGNFWGVLDVEKCYLQEEPSNKIRDAVKEFALKNGYTFFNLKEQHGLLRNLLIRNSSLGEILVLLSFFENDEEKIEKLLNHLKEKIPNITSLQYVINPKKNDTIYDLDIKTYSGKNHITEQLGKYFFKVGAKSFFQTNSKQAKVLYDVAREFAALQPQDVVYDLYTGVGSIAIYISGACKSVSGVEQIDDAIADAKENARTNNVSNCSFHSGDVRMVLKEDFIAANGKPDVVITDPPRAGMHEDVAKTLLQLESPRIVYVSCNPATQARDLQILSDKYEIKRVQPVDMFPNTTHIENVAQLELRK